MIARLNDFARPPCSRRRLTFSTRLFNLLVTNVRVRQIPLYVLGRKLDRPYPVAFLLQEPRPRGRRDELCRAGQHRPDR